MGSGLVDARHCGEMDGVRIVSIQKTLAGMDGNFDTHGSPKLYLVRPASVHKRARTRCSFKRTVPSRRYCYSNCSSWPRSTHNKRRLPHTRLPVCRFAEILCAPSADAPRISLAVIPSSCPLRMSFVVVLHAGPSLCPRRTVSQQARPRALDGVCIDETLTRDAGPYEWSQCCRMFYFADIHKDSLHPNDIDPQSPH